MTLTELYYIKDGIDIFHYSRENMDHDHFILSSSFLSAIGSFSEQVRASKIDFFSSKDEIFMFHEIDPGRTILVLVFENTIRQNVARVLKINILNLILHSKLMELPETMNLNYMDQIELRDQIRALSNSLLSVEYQITAAKELVESVGIIDFLLIYDHSKRVRHYSHMTFDLLDESDVFSSLRSLAQSTKELTTSTLSGQNFVFISVESYDFHLVIARHKTIFTMVLVKEPEDLSTVNDIPFQIMSLPSWNKFLSKYRNFSVKGSWLINHDKSISVQRGHTQTTIDQFAVSEFLQSIQHLLQALGFEEFNNITIYTDENNRIRVDQNFTMGYQTIEISKR